MKRRTSGLTCSFLASIVSTGVGQQTAGKAPPALDQQIYDIVAAVSPQRIEEDIRTLVAFGTRHTLSDTLSTTRGIGAALDQVRVRYHLGGLRRLSRGVLSR